MRYLTRSTVALFFLAFFSTGFATPTSWQHLATRSVKLSGDQDTVRIGKDEGAFQRIKLGVQENAIYLNKVEVFYGNGERQSFKVKQRLKPGEVVTFDLKGKNRVIDKMVLKYRSVKPKRERAKVQVWGKQRA